MERIYPQQTFTSYTDHMSLWEVAHRWAGFHPNETSIKTLPLAVTDILKFMMRAQIDSDLKVLKPSGVALKDWTYIKYWEQFVPYSNQEWDGSDDHKRELYVDYMSKVVISHDELVAHHLDMLSGTKNLERKYLESIHVGKQYLAKWTLENNLPFPEFWFSEDERKILIDDFNRTKAIRAKFNVDEFESKGLDIPDEVRAQILKEYESGPDEALSEVLFSNRRIKEQDIDTFWERLANNQRNRLLCRSIAAQLWKDNNQLSIAEIANDPITRTYGGAAYFSGKDTVRNWIKDLDPRPAGKKAGRPSLK